MPGRVPGDERNSNGKTGEIEDRECVCRGGRSGARRGFGRVCGIGHGLERGEQRGSVERGGQQRTGEQRGSFERGQQRGSVERGQQRGG